MIDKKISEMLQGVAKQSEDVLLEQLGDLVKKGLLVVESTVPVLTENVADNGDHTFRVSRAVRLVLKDQEYIDQLVAQNDRLTDQNELLRIENAELIRVLDNTRKGKNSYVL